MTTLQALYESLGALTDAEEREYSRRRAGKIAEIAAYIAEYLDPRDMAQPLSVIGLAEALMASAEDMNRIQGDDVHGEVASRYTRNGNPLTFTV